MRPSRCGRLLLATALAFVGLPLLGARAQTGEVTLRLVAQPVWHTPQDELDIRIEVENGSSIELQELVVALRAYSRITTRSALELFFEGSPGLFASGTSLELPDEAIAPGETATLDIDVPLSDLPTLAAATEGGVYPLEIGLGSAGAEVDVLQTPLILYPELPKERLGFVLVAPLSEVPSRDPTGAFPVDEDGNRLISAVSEGGYLRDLVAALEARAGQLPPRRQRVKVRTGSGKRARTRTRIVRVPRPSVHLGLVPTPRTVEEVADLADGFRVAGGEEGASEVSEAAAELLERLRGLVSEQGIQLLPTTYAAADLPGLVASAPEDVPRQLSDGLEVLSVLDGDEPDAGWLFPAGSRLDQHSLAALPETPDRMLLSGDSVEPPADPDAAGCPQSFATFACIIEVQSRAGRSEALVIDDGLQTRVADLKDAEDDVLARQRLFAETATIHAEVPSDPGRVVSAVLPSLWRPGRRALDALLDGIRHAPWVASMTPAEAMEHPSAARASRRLVTALPALPGHPDATFFDAVEETRAVVESFDLVRPPTEVTRRLSRNVLAAESRLLWTDLPALDLAEDYLTGTRAEIARELRSLSLGGQGDIRLTSSEGDVPLVVFNEAEYPVTVDISVTSQPELDVSPQLFEDQEIGPRSTYQFTLNTETRSSGIFQLVVAVESPDGDLTIDRKIVRVRSTRFNRIALTITVAALIFLVISYVVRFFRRARPGEEPEGTPS